MVRKARIECRGSNHSRSSCLKIIVECLCVSARSSGIQDLLCICAIYLLQCFVGKSETIQAPVIAEHAVFVEVLVGTFENSDGDSVHTLLESHVTTVEQTICILF